ncbi:transposase (fragment) [Agrobacterium deltaense NCPPB 1641]|uniref:Transposase n=1 Tax=Agrobacterium deltaense NCPPB 1641 TaxID=1183425 RepID=A0A1S7U932_9HYPH
MIRNGLQWKDSPLQYGPLGVFDRIFAALAGKWHTVANASERPDTGAEATAR